MTPLPPPLGGGEFVAWRLDAAAYSQQWDSGLGAARAGGRWNSPGTRAVYCALDPATAILEVAVHVGFDDLDSIPRVLTSFTILTAVKIRVIGPEEIPNPNWLHPGRPTTNQQHFGDSFLALHGIIVIPSAVSTRSWCLIFLADVVTNLYQFRSQERFALDPRLTPPTI